MCFSHLIDTSSVDRIAFRWLFLLRLYSFSSPSLLALEMMDRRLEDEMNVLDEIGLSSELYHMTQHHCFGDYSI